MAPPPGPGPGDQLDFDLDGRIAAGVQDFPGRHVIDDAQVNSRYEWCEGSGSNPGNGTEHAFVVPGSWGRAGVRTPRQRRWAAIQAFWAAAHARVMPQSNIWNACVSSGSTNRSTSTPAAAARAANSRESSTR